MEEVQSARRTTVRTSVFNQLYRPASLVGAGIAVGCIIVLAAVGMDTEQDFVRFAWALLVFGAGAL